MLGAEIIGARDVVMVIATLGDDGRIDSLIADSAVDIEASHIGKYWESMFDPSHLSVDMAQATIWRIQPLTRRQKRHIPSNADVMERAEWYVRCGLLSVKNRPIMDGGREVQTPAPSTTDLGQLGKVIDEKWLDEVNLPDDQIVALYRMIKHISEAPHPLSRSSSKESGDGQSNEKKEPPE